jgi:hypothetical protein
MTNTGHMIRLSYLELLTKVDKRLTKLADGPELFHLSEVPVSWLGTDWLKGYAPSGAQKLPGTPPVILGRNTNPGTKCAAEGAQFRIAQLKSNLRNRHTGVT